MKRIFSLIVLVLAICTCFAQAQADTLTFVTTLTGANEVPPTGSPGIGHATITIDGNIMTVSVQFSGLMGNTTASHIHCCAPLGMNAMVATQVPTFSGFPLGVQAGTYMNSFDMSDASSYNPAFITAHGGTVAQAEADLFAGIMGGQAYLNIHTNLFPGGEIRGQLAPVPEPATLSLLFFGLAGGVGVMRRRMLNRKS